MGTVAIGAESARTGKPFGIAGHASPTRILADRGGLAVGDFVWTGGDCHLCGNHPDRARLRLARRPRALPRLTITRRAASVDGYGPQDFALEGHHLPSRITAPVAV